MLFTNKEGKMSIKKFSLAAVLSVGLLASTMSMGFSACPLAGCSKPVTPDNAKCPKCMKTIDDCGCKEKAPENPCEEPCPEISCEQPAIPTCGVCPGSEKVKPDKQVYAYPNNVYGKNQVIGDVQSTMVIGDGQYFAATPNTLKGVPVAMDGEITGAAADCNPCNSGLPVYRDDANLGIPVDRAKKHLDSEKCPKQIHTQTSMDIEHKSYQPYDLPSVTGGAAPLISSFEDIPPGYWAGCDINNLAENKVVAGYPDRTFKPALPVSRAEFATMVLKGFNLGDKMQSPSAMFKDVPKYHWANSAINAAVSEGLAAGYPDRTFKPHNPVSRAEALTVLAKGINCPMDDCKANEILSQYCDGNEVNSWAKIPVAKALQAGVLQDMPNPNRINPKADASRADIASMLENVRVSLGYAKDDVAIMDNCNQCGESKAYVEQTQIRTIPTLRLTFNDEINAKNANIGDQFAATTVDEVVIDGVTFCAGSRVNGKVVEVIRPSKNNPGALKLAFNEIKNGESKAILPNQILSAQVTKAKTANWFMRTIEMPFTLTGQILGNAGRTVGGALVSLGNAAEEVTSGFGTATGELFTGQFKAAGRSYQDSAKALLKSPIDVTRTAISGTMGIFQISGDEIAYLLDPSGNRISQINPKEKVTIAFGCNEQ